MTSLPHSPPSRSLRDLRYTLPVARDASRRGATPSLPVFDLPPWPLWRGRNGSDCRPSRAIGGPHGVRGDPESRSIASGMGAERATEGPTDGRPMKPLRWTFRPPRASLFNRHSQGGEGIRRRRAATMPPAFQGKPIDEGGNPLSPATFAISPRAKKLWSEMMKFDEILLSTHKNHCSKSLSRSG
jgi:hypothetical protein